MEGELEYLYKLNTKLESIMLNTRKQLDISIKEENIGMYLILYSKYKVIISEWRVVSGRYWKLLLNNIYPKDKYITGISKMAN